MALGKPSMRQQSSTRQGFASGSRELLSTLSKSITEGKVQHLFFSWVKFLAPCLSLGSFVKQVVEAAWKSVHVSNRQTIAISPNHNVNVDVFPYGSVLGRQASLGWCQLDRGGANLTTEKAGYQQNALMIIPSLTSICNPSFLGVG